MKIFLIILAAIFGLILLLLICPTKVGLFYNENEDNAIRLYVKILGIKIKLLPQKKRKTKNNKACKKTKADALQCEADFEQTPQKAQSNAEDCASKGFDAKAKTQDSLNYKQNTCRADGADNSSQKTSQDCKCCKDGLNDKKGKQDESCEQINKKTDNKNKNDEKDGSKKKINISVELIMSWLAFGGDALGAIRRIIKIDKLKIYASIATPNPANTAMAYGAAALAINMGLPCIKDKITIRKTDIFVTSAFDKTQTDIEAGIIVSAVLLTMLIMGIKFFIKFKKIYKGGAL